MITSELKSKCCKVDVILGGEGQTHYYICTSCNHAADIWVDTWEDRMNWIINGHLTVGRDGRADCEWLDEDDQINMRKDLKVFITGLLDKEADKWKKIVRGECERFIALENKDWREGRRCEICGEALVVTEDIHTFECPNECIKNF